MTALFDPAQVAGQQAHAARLPSHVYWSFGGEDFARIDTTKPYVFQYTFDANAVQILDPKAAVQAALLRYAALTSLPFAICLSGSDSEIIAREAKALDLQFELFFLNIWDNNSIERAVAEQIASQLGKTLNVITLTKNDAIHQVLPQTSAVLQAAKPTYLVLPHLLQSIGTGYFIIGGEGDLEKNSPEYSFDSGTQVPFGITEVFYRQVIIDAGLNGDMYFFASTPELIMSFRRHPLIQTGENFIDTRNVKSAIWPELLYTTKTNNWSNVEGSNAEIRMLVHLMLNQATPILQPTCNFTLS